MLALLVVAGCDGSKTQEPPKPQKPSFPVVVTHEGEIFASAWKVSIVAKDSATLGKAQVQKTLIVAALKEVERQVSAWDRGSEIAKFSRTLWIKPLVVSPSLATLVQTSLDVGAATDGAFDVTIGPLLDVWGFSPSTKGKVTAPPSAADIEAAKAKTGLALLHTVPGALQKDREHIAVDLTAVGDGAAAAAVMAGLRERGFTDVLVDVAGEVVVAGAGAKGPWRVGVNVPSESAAPTDVERTVPLATSAGALRALSTSGTYREAFSADGKRYSHILDPRTGSPVQHDLVSCSVVGPDLVVADALSTACLVMGQQETTQKLAKFPGYSVLFLTAKPDGTFASTTTEGFPEAQKKAE